MANFYNLVLIILLCGLWRYVNCLSVTHIDVPELADFRDRVTLSCSYNMGGHKLNSVKWYKDEQEFFRYSPMMHPVFMKFPVDGIAMPNDKYFCNEGTCSIDLGQLTPKSSGAYRCEVSGDAPEFKLTTRMSNMTVAALPQHDPLINGVSLSYRMDEYVVANCTSDWSSPPAVLSWYINNEKAYPEMLQPQQETTTTINDYTLKSRSLEIRFYLNTHIFLNSKGFLNLKCVAEINQLISYRRERTVTSYVISDDLTNQKLINSSPSHYFHDRSHITLVIGLVAIIRFLLVNNSR